jgi:hypothetical protein
MIDGAELVWGNHNDFAIELTDYIQRRAILGEWCEQATGAFQEERGSVGASERRSVGA